MIGISLEYKSLKFSKDDDLRPQILLPKLREHNVQSIELRTVHALEPADNVLRVANLLWDYGFQVTVHSKCESVESAVSDVFGPLADVLKNLRQRELIVTIHPVIGDNVLMLTELSDYITEQGYPVRIALENNRKMPDKTDGDCLSFVLDAVTRANRKNIGVCFDMGHWAWYTANFTSSPNMLPPKVFLSRTIHTHIHSYTEGLTHFPLDQWREPFSRYIEALAYNYYGTYNIELEPKRFKHLMNATEAYLLSADVLKNNYPFHATLYDYMRFHYDDCFRQALDVFKKTKGCHFTLVSPSSYLFSTNGYRWAMDVSFLYLRELAEAPSKILQTLGDIELMVLTHAHRDHMEEYTIRTLADTEITWLVPDFIVDDMLRFGVRREKLIVVKAGDSVTVGPLDVKVFKGRHFRPDDGVGVEAVGYLISADGTPSVAFPCDVRDYRVTEDGIKNADHCFAHVWLTDEALDPEMYTPKSREFADFMLNVSRKSIFLTHLYGNRPESKTWKMNHARIVEEEIRKRSPEISVRVPKYGEIIELK